MKKAIYKDGISSFAEITTLPKKLREALSERISILSFDVQGILEAKNKEAIKASLRLRDGNFIETVLISPRPGTWSACISSQVGCPLGCEFCETGKTGFKRNLTGEEITDQILFWRQYLKKVSAQGTLPADKQGFAPGVKNFGITNIVYMGMGEPFLNWENVRESLRAIMDEKMLAFGSRSISISTAGIPEGIENLAKEFPQINLAVSLHFADDEKRTRFMPVNKKYDLEKLKEALQKYFSLAKRKVFIEYIMMAGVNDGEKDARKLEKYLRSIGNIHLLHVNLISYNPGHDKKFNSPDKEAILGFRNYFLEKRINCTIRKSLGQEIAGACGQLARRSENTSVS